MDTFTGGRNTEEDIFQLKAYSSHELILTILLINLAKTANVFMCNATASKILIDNGWCYLASPACHKKVLEDGVTCGGPKCQSKVKVPIASVHAYPTATTLDFFISRACRLMQICSRKMIQRYQHGSSSGINCTTPLHHSSIYSWTAYAHSEGITTLILCPPDMIASSVSSKVSD
ncbi:hypothetical protein MKW98_017060 [Papaver atlanticum]|uniref:Uncharacterized protein n=1 Tax=Papaver atlanticum TaxID=357466 RepID=A0AAD4XVZ1_9MAGN|nr:hypothetical protein MKW98_017060 [Papaver atlanticum]